MNRSSFYFEWGGFVQEQWMEVEARSCTLCGWAKLNGFGELYASGALIEDALQHGFNTFQDRDKVYILLGSELYRCLCSNHFMFAGTMSSEAVAARNGVAVARAPNPGKFSRDIQSVEGILHS